MGEAAQLPDLQVASFFLFFFAVQTEVEHQPNVPLLPLSSALQEERPRTLMARGINYVVIYLLLLGLRGSFESGATAPLSF